MARSFLHRLTYALVFVSTIFLPVHRGARGEIVYDPWNYSQNYIAALRALQQVNNQLREIQTQLAMLEALNKSVSSTGTSFGPQLQAGLQRYTALTQQGIGIALKVQETEAAFQKLFPSQAPAAASSSPALTAAQGRWQTTLSEFQRASVLSAATVDGLAADQAMLTQLLTRSRNSAGSLEAAQAGNELQALGIKQSLQLQVLLAAHARAGSFERARTLATQSDAQAGFQSFLGAQSAYSASGVALH